ncbi:MAG: response regulator [Burkholderiaceae bacterium]|nr:response regulator [Burkholderiaceae bacterium]
MNEARQHPDDNASVDALHRRALVVDDNADNAESLAMLMRLHGDDVRTAHNGVDALEIGECFQPQIVLLDIGMPRMNGYETCRALRERTWGRTAIVIAQTGWGQTEDRQRALQAGFDAHLVKPIEFATLTELLATLDAERVEGGSEGA